MKVLVTGGNGFVGSHLVQRLAEKGHEVEALVKHSTRASQLPNDIKTHTTELLDIQGLKKMVREFQPEVVCNLAALTPVRFSFDNPFIYAQTNYIGTMNMVFAAMESSILKKFIHASTAETYLPKDIPMKETDELYGSTPYGVSKVAADYFIRVAGDCYGLPYIVLRPTNTYGRKTEKGYFMEKIITTMLTSEKLVLDGTPEVIRDWMFVEDHVQGYLRAIEGKAINEVFNISTGIGMTLGDTVETIRKVIGWDGEVVWGNKPRPNDPKYLVLDNSKAKQMLNFDPEYTLEQGVKRTIEIWK
ncbi:MAG: GDP-mannose 4,6-dehydratase [Candidatus Aenigmatarchaeota archaeon]